MFNASPDLTRALLEDRRSKIAEMRRVSTRRKSRAASSTPRHGRVRWPFWPRDPQRA